jgi:hypothetical protein
MTSGNNFNYLNLLKELIKVVKYFFRKAIQRKFDMWPLFFSLLLLIASCGEQRTSMIEYGKTTVLELKAVRGMPTLEKKIPVKDGMILIYHDQTFQARGEIITHGFRQPQMHEKNLLYWKHSFRDCQTGELKISSQQSPGLMEVELICSQKGISVIYLERSSFISRIIENEKK